ncbi:Hypothetical predicted protein, partial [Mytilus galloprovincialis]
IYITIFVPHQFGEFKNMTVKNAFLQQCQLNRMFPYEPSTLLLPIHQVKLSKIKLSLNVTLNVGSEMSSRKKKITYFKKKKTTKNKFTYMYEQLLKFMLLSNIMSIYKIDILRFLQEVFFLCPTYDVEGIMFSGLLRFWSKVKVSLVKPWHLKMSKLTRSCEKSYTYKCFSNDPASASTSSETRLSHVRSKIIYLSHAQFNVYQDRDKLKTMLNNAKLKAVCIT